MKRLLQFAIALLLSALPAHAAPTVTIAGTAGVFGGSVTTLATPAYNQASGHCLAVIVEFCCNTSTTSVGDTASDSFANSIAQFQSGNGGNRWYAAYTVTNGAASASNIVTVTFGSAIQYGTLTYLDISGCATSSAIDVAAGQQGPASVQSSVSQNITTAKANEAIITTLFQTAASLTSATAPAGFTAGSVVSNFSLTGYEVVSSIQSGVTLTWSSVSAANFLNMLTLSFAGASSSRAQLLAGVGP